MKEPKPLRNKGNEKFLLVRLKAKYGEDFDPIMQIAKNAAQMQQVIDDKISAETSLTPEELATVNKEWERMAQFTHPKLKSVEHVGGDGMFEIHVHRK